MIRMLGWVAMALLPPLAIAAARFVQLQAVLDARAKRTFLRHAGFFLVSSAAASIVLFLGAGRLALPVIPVLLLSVLALKSMFRALFPRGQ